jgi:hypothetical protein
MSFRFIDPFTGVGGECQVTSLGNDFAMLQPDAFKLNPFYSPAQSLLRGERIGSNELGLVLFTEPT